jgi:hypothetical protein
MKRANEVKNPDHRALLYIASDKNGPDNCIAFRTYTVNGHELERLTGPSFKSGPGSSKLRPSQQPIKAVQGFPQPDVRR